MIDAIMLLFLFFRSRASNLFNWGFAFKSILYPREAIVTCEDLKEYFTFDGELKHLPTYVQNQAAATAKRPKNVREFSHHFL